MQPPRLGVLLLERFGPQNEALLGDLAEECRSGRSVFWYWRQVVVVVALNCLADVRRDWFMVLRGIVTGVALLMALGWIVAPIGAQFHRWLLRYPWGVIMMQFNLGYLIHLALWFPASVVAGWIVARLHRRYRAGALFGLVLTIGILTMSHERFYFLLKSSFTHERFIPYLTLYVFQNVVGMVGVLIGALVQPTTVFAESRLCPGDNSHFHNR